MIIKRLISDISMALTNRPMDWRRDRHFVNFRQMYVGTYDKYLSSGDKMGRWYMSSLAEMTYSLRYK